MDYEYDPIKNQKNIAKKTHPHISSDEESAIQLAIATDPDTRQISPSEMATAVKVQDSNALASALDLAKKRGKQKAPTKQATTIRLSPEVMAFFKATGKGWQSRIDDALREYVTKHGDV